MFENFIPFMNVLLHVVLTGIYLTALLKYLHLHKGFSSMCFWVYSNYTDLLWSVPIIHAAKLRYTLVFLLQVPLNISIGVLQHLPNLPLPAYLISHEIKIIVNPVCKMGPHNISQFIKYINIRNSSCLIW